MTALEDGSAWERFVRLVRAQGGDVSYIEHPERLPAAKYQEVLPSPASGYLLGIHARQVGETAVTLGAGRERLGDPIDHAVGIEVHAKVGDRVEKGQPLFTIHANQEELLGKARQELLQALAWSEHPVDRLPLFYGVIE
jgi:pyrimidine-nucleoside phosphorylase